MKSIENYIQLERLANDVKIFENPVGDFIISTKKDAKKAATIVRKKWKLGNAPIRKVIDVLEENGIKVVELQCLFSFQGLSGRFNEIPVIVINSSVNETTRRRFTLLHELGHLILDIDDNIKDDDQLIERICDSFAGALLLPEEIIINEFKNRSKVSLAELICIKEKYGVSIQAILFRAAESGLNSWDDYHNWKQQDHDVVAGNYPVEEKSDRMLRLARKCVIEDRISHDKAVKLSGALFEEIVDINQTLYTL